MTDKDISPLYALADAFASEKQIMRILMREATGACREALLYYSRNAVAPHNAILRKHIRVKLEAALDKRYFAGFGRKKTIDKAIKKTLADTSAVRFNISREADRRCAERERKYGDCPAWDRMAIHRTVVRELWPI